MSDSARERGLAVYEKSFGNQRESNPEDTVLDDFALEHLFADVWSHPNLKMPQRSMIAAALLAALSKDRDIANIACPDHSKLSFVSLGMLCCNKSTDGSFNTFHKTGVNLKG